MVNNYYEKSKEKLQKETSERYKNLSEEEKDKTQKKTPRERYQNLIKNKKKKLNNNLSLRNKRRN